VQLVCTPHRSGYAISDHPVPQRTATDGQTPLNIESFRGILFAASWQVLARDFQGASCSTVIMRSHSLIPAGLIMLLAVGAAAAGPTFTSTWSTPEATGVTFAGAKVAALVVTSDQHLRISVEEQLARELGTRRILGTPTYRLAPVEELGSAERARPWFERANVQGVVVLRPVSMETSVTHYEGGWTSESYSTLWGYYGYGWSTSAVYTPARTTKETTLVVETLVYSVPLDRLLWGGVSSTTNPKEVPTFLKQLVNAAVAEMRKRGLAQ
jgi:hypothetical protein